MTRIERTDAPDPMVDSPLGDGGEGLDDAPPDDRKITLRVLIADKDTGLLENCRSILVHEGHECDTLDESGPIRDALSRGGYDLVLVHEGLLGGRAQPVLRMSRDDATGPLVVLMSDRASADRCRKVLAMGAWDYFPKPFSSGQLMALIGRASYTLERTKRVRVSTDEGGVLLNNGLTILGVSQQIRTVLEKALRVASTDAPVLLIGESGTGKELFARLIHEKSRRARNRLVPLNCAALPGDLLESEMFGHRRGAFTGAVRDKAGILEAADNGTVFLDEIGEMPLSLQAKLLRVVQDGALRRVGSERIDRTVNVRIISATNRDPEEALATGHLREDLLYRLGVVTIQLTPLRERPNDTLVLARHFTPILWQQYRPSAGPPPFLSDEAQAALLAHPWPGNVRELRNVLGHAVIFASPGQEIGVEDLPLKVRTRSDHASWEVGNGRDAESPFDLRGTYHDAKERMLARFERAYVSWIIARTEGNLCEAARQGEINRATLYRLMEKHGLSRDDLVEGEEEDPIPTGLAGGGPEEDEGRTLRA